MTMTVEALAAAVSGEIHGDAARNVADAQSLEKAGPHEITFVAGEKNLRKLAASAAGTVLIGRALANQVDLSTASRTFIVVDDAQTAFMDSLELLRPKRSRSLVGVSHHAFVHPTVTIGPNTNIHPGAHLSENAVIGANCDIHPGVVVGPGCVLGDNVILYPNAVLYDDVRIGNRVIIHASAVIGADGFGYRLVDGQHKKIPHYGTVRIEDDVEIGAGTTVDRGMVGATVIGQGTKLDNLVMIAHNCEIGRHNIFVSQVGLAGSVTTGDYVVCAGQVGIADHVHLGDQCVVGAKAGVHKDMPGGQTYLGAPAMPEAEAIKVVMAQRKLPEMRKQIRTLEAEVAALTQRLDALLASHPSAARPAA